jgi:hypothetical protein
MGWGRGYMLRRYGVMRGPRRAIRALAGEIVISGGQLLIDQNASGIIGRIAGWRSAAAVGTQPYPVDGLEEISLGEALARRGLRRHTTRRLRWSST